MEKIPELEMAARIAEEVRKASGRAYFAGGFVRDRLLGRESKDMDLEIHGIPVEMLEKILDRLGERIAVGADFGVMKLRHYDLDIAMPRSEHATGRGHRDFDVIVDPFLGEEKAARRRDFTVNAMMQDVLTGEILDFFGGREDLQNKRIRHVSSDTFPEDPLRVFRAAQFAARFGFTVAPETAELCAGMAVDALAGERVMAELEKALLAAETPSMFFEVLREMQQLRDWFPETGALIGVPQNPEHHPEGDVWKHTMQVIDAAASLRELSRIPLALMLAALCHDFGKADTTTSVDGRLHAYGHEAAGVPAADRFLGRLTKEVRLRTAVLDLVRHHMEPNRLVSDRAGTKSYMKLFDRTKTPEELLLLAKADHMGRCAPGQSQAALKTAYVPAERKLGEMLALYRQRMAGPHVMGRDLIEAGIQPDNAFGPALKYAHKLQLAGLDKEEQLRQTLGYFRSHK